MNAKLPLVSVVIPTYNRPDCLVHAIDSVLRQTINRIEAIVVLDGPDDRTLRELDCFAEDRLKVIVLAARKGAAEARNIGVEAARGRWIAFLDDDDVWMPEKLALQIPVAEKSQWRLPIAAGRVIARSKNGEFLWPRRGPAVGEDLSEYLFCRKTPFGGEGLLLPSVLLVPKELLEKVPFQNGLERHNDVDWLLRVAKVDGVGIEFIASSEPLAIWCIDEQRPRISLTKSWQYSLAWIQQSQYLVTPAAYASFVLTWISTTAQSNSDWSALPILLQDALKNGRPSLNDLITFFGVWLMPRKLRQLFARGFDKICRKVNEKPAA
jgi:glycosyltransferase involved in cell wall biosynthesis